MEEITLNVLPSFEQMASSTARCKQQIPAVKKINIKAKSNDQFDGLQPEKIRLKLFNFETESLKEFNSIIHI